VAGPTIPQPQFPDDDGGADPRLGAALIAYAAGRVGEHTVLAELMGARLLVPVVAVITEKAGAPAQAQAESVPAAEPTPSSPEGAAESAESAGSTPSGADVRIGPRHGSGRAEKESEMALPTLIGADGRRGMLGFTSLETLARWRPDARPVAVYSQEACQAVLDEHADALVIDVAGPVPFAVDGYRLFLFAEGKPIPPPYEDPEVLAAVEAAFGTEDGVSRIRVAAGSTAELAVRFTLAGDVDERATVQRVADRLAEQLRGRIVGGVELAVVRG
jgi:type III secretion system (T3SS) SseB-like protein